MKILTTKPIKQKYMKAKVVIILIILIFTACKKDKYCYICTQTTKAATFETVTTRTYRNITPDQMRDIERFGTFPGPIKVTTKCRLLIIG